ncbi:MAG: hypothetical protein M5U34_31680 [Chloroflexi bacterium]|nr:hypothetical protein [Chloroflexota bacterium]
MARAEEKQRPVPHIGEVSGFEARSYDKQERQPAQWQRPFPQ